MSSILLEQVWKFYGDVEAVRDLTLHCDDGEMLALLGPSGCGKSTTLKMIAGVEAVSRGEIYFGKRPVSALAPGQRNIAMVFEDYALYPHLTVYENIAFPLKVRGANALDIKARAGNAVELLGLGGLANENVKALSGGAQQRVSIGRALVRDPELILFDEPLSHLDADQKVHLRAEIKRLQQSSGLTSILVTHDQTEAVAMSDRVAVLNLGVLQQVATPEELYAAPANLFVANFIGEPPMNLLAADVSRQRDRLLLRGAGWHLALSDEQSKRLEAAAPQSPVTAGLRPEHVTVSPSGVTKPMGDKSDGRITGQIYFRERRGDADVLTVTIDPDISCTDGNKPQSVESPMITAEIDGPSFFSSGDVVTLALAADKLCIFDRNSGANLLLKAS